MNNIDDKTVASFGDELSRFDKFLMSEAKALKEFDVFFQFYHGTNFHKMQLFLTWVAVVVDVRDLLRRKLVV